MGTQHLGGKMKKIILTSILTTLTLLPAYAQSKILKCANDEVSIQIKILDVTDNPTVKVLDFKADMLVVGVDSEGNNNVNKTAHVHGLLVGNNFTKTKTQSINANGDILNQDHSDVIINPESINLSLELSSNGTASLSLYDHDRIFQHGYGLFIACK